MAYDVIVVGASFAGLSAAMQLARARKAVLLVDAGQPRNRFSPASHGFLGQDGAAPAEIMRKGLGQLSAYPTVDFVHGLAEAASGERDDFELRLPDGKAARGRRMTSRQAFATSSRPSPGSRSGGGRQCCTVPTVMATRWATSRWACWPIVRTPATRRR